MAETITYSDSAIQVKINAKKAWTNRTTAIQNQTKSTYQSWNRLIDESIKKAASNGQTECTIKNIPKAQATSFIAHCCDGDQEKGRYVVYFKGKDGSNKDINGYIGREDFKKSDGKYDYSWFFPNKATTVDLKISWKQQDVQAVHKQVDADSEWTAWNADAKF